MADKELTLVKPVASSRDIAEAIGSYREIQQQLDAAMPDCIQHIAGKAFRKKNYWRAVKTAFNLSVECIKEEKITIGEDWGFIVTYRAKAPNGATADGDGACTFSEKGKGNMVASLHNIRSQAHTRAFNRAVSNLVGFGEVSAEEVVEEKEEIKEEPKEEPKQEKKELSKYGKYFWALLCDAYKTEDGKPDKETIKDAIKELTGKTSLFECTEKEIKAAIEKFKFLTGADDATS